MLAASSLWSIRALEIAAEGATSYATYNGE